MKTATGFGLFILMLCGIGCGDQSGAAPARAGTVSSNFIEGNTASEAADPTQSAASPSPDKAGLAPAEGAALAAFGFGEKAEIRDLDTWPDGSVVACGVLFDGAEAPGDGTVQKLLSGNHETGLRPFVMKLSGGIDRLAWFSLLPADTIDPTRVLALSDGGVAIGGKHLKELAALDQSGSNWKKSRAALMVFNADGGSVRWMAPGGPNQDVITGMTESSGRLYFTAGSFVRSASNYILRKDIQSGEQVEWAETGWCVYLHTNQEALQADGQFMHFYRKSYESKDGFDYDGPEGWGPVRFYVKGFRIGGQVVALPDGDIVVTSCLQYDFREKGKKGFPAFDLLVARYSSEGELRWSTNLYQPGDSVHTPDQKPVDLTYDPRSDSLYVLAKQHGSNVYRFKGKLVGDTGNLMISWLGKVDASSGDLEDGWYFQTNRLGNFEANGIPKSPPYPKLSGNSLQRVRVGNDGLIYVAGSGAPKTWTTEDAWQKWPAEKQGGGLPVVIALTPDLKTVQFASCFFAEGDGGRINGLAVTPHTIVVGGRAVPTGGVAERCRSTGWSDSSETTAGCMLWTLK